MIEFLRQGRLNTVCQSAHCPNLGECFSRGTATFMILGDVCTRNCGFCAIATGKPRAVDPLEPIRVALAARQLGLRHVVVTSVDRDDLSDGGASQFAATIEKIRALCKETSVEVLTPDFRGDRGALDIVLEARPEVYNHNVETVPRLYRLARAGSNYQRSLQMLRWAAESGRTLLVKSGLMVGLGETPQEMEQVMRDLYSVGCRALTVGQYLAPSRAHLPVVEFVPPEQFQRYEEQARAIGFEFVAAGPFVRSSFHAEDFYLTGRV